MINLAPGETIEVWVDGRLVDGELEYLEFSDYLDNPPGNHRVVAKQRGVLDPDVLNTLYPLREDLEYTVAFSDTKLNSGLELSFLIDNCPLSEHLAQVRFTDLLLNSPPMDVSIQYGPTLYENFSYMTSSNCVSVPPDDYTLIFSRSGTGGALFTKEVTFEEGYRYNLFLAGDLAKESTKLKSLTQVNKPEEVPKIFGVERSVLQLLGAGIIASLVILLVAQ